MDKRRRLSTTVTEDCSTYILQEAMKSAKKETF